MRKACEVIVSKDGHSITWSTSMPPDPSREYMCGEPAVEVSENGVNMCALHWDAYNEDHVGPATTEMFRKALRE